MLEGTEDTSSHRDIVPISEILPPNLVLLPVSQTTFFPGMMIPVILPEGKLARTVEHALKSDGYVGVVLNQAANAEVVGHAPPTTMTGLPPERARSKATAKMSEFFPFGIAAKVVKKINLPDNQVSVLLAGVQRFKLSRLVAQTPFTVGAVEYLYEEVERGIEQEALLRAALTQFKQLAKDNPLISEEVKVALINIDGPGKLADFMASVLIRDVNSYQEFLSTAEVNRRLHHLLLMLKKEQNVQTVQKKIQDDVNQKISASQREYYLQEQLKSIQRELGREGGERGGAAKKLRRGLEGKKLPIETKKQLGDEFEKLESLHEQSSEYSVLFNYLDWAAHLPWGVRSTENYSLSRAREILERDHFGLKEVKTRILEYLAVRKLKQTSEGSILCFVGPPGSRKTSLGKSIAEALHRKFFRFSVGGMRDEAEIKGHRRTYVGAMPGKVIQGLKRVGTQNPVFLIDEIDKMGQSWASGGDPSSALLEVLDPEQNREFHDHYLDLPFDCSEIFFITTANSIDTIPPALLDRMEIIALHGYTDREKMRIAVKHLLPKIRTKHALGTNQIRIRDRALQHIVSHYAREAGVRNLERQLARICRKTAYRIAMGRADAVTVEGPKDVEKLLGLAPYQPESGFTKPTAGVVTGLAWTQYGGDTLFIESKVVQGKGGFLLTGTLGKVMQESANIAYTFVRDRSRHLSLPKWFFERNTFHLHVPSGATPKDGPSAGIAMASSLYSLLLDKAPPKHLGVTGELTLTGQVLPVGGIKEKLLAAKRSGLRTVVLPAHNRKDLREIDRDVQKGLKIRFVSTMDECLKEIFGKL